MKRKALIQHLSNYNCQLLREGRKHTVFYNPVNTKTSTLPRHREINGFLARKICRDLGIPEL